MITPTPAMILVCLLLTCTGLAAGFFSPLVLTWKIAASLVCGIWFVDLLLCLKLPQFKITRTIHNSLPATAWSSVSLKILSGQGRTLTVTLHDDHPPQWEIQGLPAVITLVPKQCAEHTYRLYPTMRGDFTFNGVDVVVASPLSFWRRKWFISCMDKVKVFPNFREISHYTLLATHHHLSMMGIKKLIRQGGGKEFHQLREYRQGDEFQKIDWKATSRLGKLISKEYQDERDQQIVFVLDCGRRMSHVDSESSHLDQALNSILLLAYVASRQGDAVGLYSFGGTQKWHPPRKESGSVRHLLLAAYDIQASQDSSDYLNATESLLALQQRRSLLVIITNSRSEDYDDLLQMARQFRQKHLVVIADLRESVLDEAGNKSIQGLDDAIHFQGLQSYLVQRKTLFKQLSHLGVIPLDVTADQLPAAIVNTYLEIKGAGRL